MLKRNIPLIEEGIQVFQVQEVGIDPKECSENLG